MEASLQTTERTKSKQRAGEDDKQRKPIHQMIRNRYYLGIKELGLEGEESVDVLLVLL